MALMSSGSPPGAAHRRRDALASYIRASGDPVLIDELTQQPGIVLATGGGSAQNPENRAHLHDRGFVVYLHATVDQQLTRTRRGRPRPLLLTGDPREVLARLMAIRDPQYREIAHLVIETDGRRVPAVVREIRRNIPSC